MAELWDLYNEKREKTGVTLLKGIPIPKGLYHLVVSAWIKNNKGQYLLSQRHPDKAYPYYWECTGGSILAGEDSLKGAIREVKEELGISLQANQGKLIYQVRREQQQDFYDVWIFRMDIDIAKISLQQSEVINAKWVNRDELFSLFQDGKLHPLLNYIEQII